MAKNKTLSHKNKIRNSMIGKKSSEEKKRKISQALSGSNHPRSLLWTIQAPNGNIFITKDIRNLCRKFNLPYSTLRLKHQQRYSSPIWQGRAKGWAVLKTEVVSKSLLQPFEVIDLL